MTETRPAEGSAARHRREPVRLWDGPAPGSETWTHDEQDTVPPPVDGAGARNVVVPTITPHLPATPTDHAVLVCPGGALHFVAMEHEGHQVADRLAASGAAAFVLKYRVVPTPDDVEEAGKALMAAFADMEATLAPVLPLAVADAERALALVRADGYRHVTLLGFSAGARIGAELVLRGDPGARPDAAAFVYLPWVQLPAEVSGGPPLFLLMAADDPLGIGATLDLHRAWREADLPVDLHLFAEGGHGFGANRTRLPVDLWQDLFIAWHHTQAGRTS